MIKMSKRMKLINKEYDKSKSYSSIKAFTLLKKLSIVKFLESIDVSINLGVDPRKSDQIVRGASLLPNGTGKTVRVAVFAQGENFVKAQNSGADFVGMDDLADSIRKGKINFDVIISTPDAMKVVSKLGQILGPRGLMPNPKVGTVTNDVDLAIKQVKSGQIRYRVDKSGIIHTTIGKINFEPSDLQENLVTLLSDLKKLKPSHSKGVYLKKVIVSSTMGPGIKLDITSL